MTIVRRPFQRFKAAVCNAEQDAEMIVNIETFSTDRVLTSSQAICWSDSEGGGSPYHIILFEPR